MTKGLSNRLPIPDNKNTRAVLAKFVKRTIRSSQLNGPPSGFTNLEWSKTIKVLELIEKALNLN